MWDSAADDQLPPDGEAYAGYVDGSVGNQPNYAYVVAHFPYAHHLSIANDPAHNADTLDVEPGDASPEAVPGWYARQRERGMQRPCLYASVSAMETFAVPLIQAARIPRSQVRLWTAHYQGEHICGPSSCGELSIEADGTQWTNSAMGRTLDQSLLAADFFGPVTPPPDWTFGAPLDLRVIAGHESVRLAWDPPSDTPEHPSGYLVYIYRGETCNRSTLVPTYPRGAKSSPWEGGSLQRGATYTAHVVASGPGGTRVRPFTYVSAAFTTG